IACDFACGRVAQGSQFPALPTCGAPRSEVFMKKMLILALFLVGIGGSLGFWYWKANARPRSNYRVVPAERGPFLATIAATGTVQPEEVIDVGAQVAGRIDRFGLEFKEVDKRLLVAIIGGLSRHHGVAGSVSLPALVFRQPA